MPRVGPSEPPYLRHRRKGRADTAYTLWAGERIELGPYGSEQSFKRLRRLRARVKATGRVSAPDAETMTITQLVQRFMEHAEHHYRKPDGRRTSMWDNYQAAMRVLTEQFGTTRVADFGVLELIGSREAMVVTKCWCRKTVNKSVHLIRAVFRWGTCNLGISANIYDTLRALGIKISPPVRRASGSTLFARPFDTSDVYVHHQA